MGLPSRYRAGARDGRGRPRGDEMAGVSREKSGKGQAGAEEKLVARNRRATFDYALEDRFEAGLVLTGSEVKSLRDGKVEIVDAYATIESGEAFLYQLYVAPFEQASYFGHEPRRKRKLLLHRREIEKLGGALKDRGYTLIPIRLYFKGSHAKLELALARGKTHGDKRQDIARKDAEREARNAMGRSAKERSR
jgi:SsrA-binding protein